MVAPESWFVPHQFGGKLITFENPKMAPVQSPQPVPMQVFVSQVTTETEFLQRSRELQVALQSGSFNSYCQAKIQSAKSEAEQDIWKFLLVGRACSRYAETSLICYFFEATLLIWVWACFDR